MKTSKWMVMILAAAVTAGGLKTLQAQSADSTARPQAQARHHFLERARQALGLTDDQVAHIRDVISAEKDRLKDLFVKLHETRVALRQAIQAPDATDASVRAASAKVAAVEADLAVERLHLHAKISPILTAPQREKLDQLEARWDEVVDRLLEGAGRKSSD